MNENTIIPNDVTGDKSVDAFLTGIGLSGTLESWSKTFHNFDPAAAYPRTKGSHVMRTENHWKRQLGRCAVTLLNMGYYGAEMSELVKVVKHSMVVSRAYKEGLDYKRSEKDCDFREIEKRYLALHKQKGETA